MNKAKALVWFEEVEKKASLQRNVPTGFVRMGNETPVYVFRDAEVLAFVTAASQAIRRVFPPGDPIVRSWDQIYGKGDASALNNDDNCEAAVALFREAHAILKSDRFDTLIEGVRAETVGELVDQADVMLANGWLSAAMVTAGGAIESTLRHLCEHANPPITIKGHGSIEKYNSAIGERRTAGTEILSANQSKLVTAWGGLRNDAAHDPKTFQGAHTKENVRATIDGIRQFLAMLTT